MDIWNISSFSFYYKQWCSYACLLIHTCIKNSCSIGIELLSSQNDSHLQGNVYIAFQSVHMNSYIYQWYDFLLHHMINTIVSLPSLKFLAIVSFFYHFFPCHILSFWDSHACHSSSKPTKAVRHMQWNTWNFPSLQDWDR